MRVCCTTVEMQESDVEELERRAIRVWMRTVMSTQNWSANEWAVKANTSPTNITRFLNSDATYIPTARTLGKLAYVAGSSPQLVNKGQETGLIKHPVKNVDGDVVDMIVIEGENVECYQLGLNTGMWGSGISPHSYVVVDRTKFNDLTDGNIILFEDDEHGLLCAEVLRFNAHFRIMNMNVPLADWQPRRLVSLRKKYIGRVTQSIVKF